MQLEDFKFTDDELVLIANIQYHVLQIEKKEGKESLSELTEEALDKALEVTEGALDKIAEKAADWLRSKTGTKVEKISRLHLKGYWIERWQESAWKLLKIEDKPYTNEQLNSKLQEFYKISTLQKRVNLAVQCSLFTAYFPLEKDDKQLYFDTSVYLNQLEKILFPLQLPDNSMVELNRDCNSYIKQISNELKTPFQKYAPIIIGLVGAVTAAIAAPFLAGGIGALMGLSGAAATSAGLAFLGGGAISAGGGGMVMGFAILMGGGAVVGTAGGKVLSDEEIEELRSKEYVVASAQLLSMIKLMAVKKLINFKDVYGLLEDLRGRQFSIEDEIDRAICMIEDIEPKIFEKYKKDVAVFDFTRKKILGILVDNKD